MTRQIIAAATVGLAFGIAGAANSAGTAPEARAYFSLSFGGERRVPHDFHYGLRVDHDSRFIEVAPPPLLLLDFTHRGVNAARVNGLSVLRPEYRLRQTDPPADSPEEMPAETPSETPAETPAETPGEIPAETLAEMPAEDVDAAADEPGFFSRAWKGIKGWFGAGDDATETASGEASEEEATDFGAVDWGLVAVGAVGVGLAVGEISNDDETGSDGGTTDGGATGDTTGGTTGDTTGGTPGGLLGGLAGGLSGYTRAAPERELEREIEHRKWLDGGTGQMGDLGGPSR